MRRFLMVCFFLAGGVVLAVHLSHRLAPVAAPLTVVEPGGWVTTPQPAARAYFRHDLHVPFVPEHAWVCLSANDYTLYVNGVKVGRNLSLLEAGNALQSRLSSSAQSLGSGRSFKMNRDPTLRQRANDESRLVHWYDLRECLRPGRNVIAVYVQADSPEHLGLALRGEVLAGPVRVPIPDQAGLWRASVDSTPRNNMAWYDVAYDDSDWPHARAGKPPADQAAYSVVPPAVFTRPLVAPAVTAAAPGDELIFRTVLPAVRPGSRAWLRIRSSWAYEAFVGAGYVGGGGGPHQVDAFDVSQYLRAGPTAVAVRLYRHLSADGSASAAADLPWLVVDGQVGEVPLSTGAGWSQLAGFHPDWLRGGGEWVPAAPHSVSQRYTRVRFQTPDPPERRWLLRLGRHALLLACLLAVVGLGLGSCFRAPQAGAAGVACWLLAPPLFGVLLVELLRFRFQESDTLLLFLSPAGSRVLLATGPVLFLLALLVTGLRRGAWLPLGLFRALARVPAPVWLVLILAGALALRLYRIDFQQLQFDENVSWDTARGILRTGLPQSPSGVYYTRSPLYHYLLAGWLWLFGDNYVSARCFSLVPGLGVIGAGYALVVALTRRRYLGLLAALLLALSPWELHSSSFIRFYQLGQLLVVLCTLFFLKGFVWQQGKRYQNLFFVCASCGVLSQEALGLIFPPLFLAFFACYRGFSWKADLNVWVGFAFTMGIAVLDLATFGFICNTPHVGVATWSSSVFQLNFRNVTEFTTTFYWMTNGANALVTVFFVAGLAYWLRRPDGGAMLVLYAVVVMMVVGSTVLLRTIAPRYAYAPYPLLLSGALISADALIRRCTAGLSWSADAVQTDRKRTALGLLLGGVALAGCLVSFELDKVADSYGRDRYLEHQVALGFIAERRRPEDALMTVLPVSTGIEGARADYYATGPRVGFVRFDEVYLRPRGGADRWEGGRPLWQLEQYQKAFLKHERVWVLVSDYKLGLMAPEVAQFLRASCSVEYEFFGGQVLLWDRSAGRLCPVPDRGCDLGGY
jgi:4-amino-4-deoxy-L-arabinose transferase-like glycosyltransferase